ncbi:ranBP-type and C3HC4-type zinc finger-containing protein 1 isoform X1 [Petromyzon marinus]|uniref:ranBP-type and C3HC4-type zinc finger-containing protein 1 isoform X1 n=1 Tax=Petromyzon marinus TaxID=7757 RepID=UPI003F6EC23D
MEATQDLSETLVQSELLSVQLGRAIHAGDVAAAQQLAARLAECRSPLLVQLKTPGQSSSSFRIKVQVEDTTSSVGPIYVKVSSHMTVDTLKQQIFRHYDIHPKVQRWVINQRLAEDSKSLHSYGLQREGDEAFLYLVSAQQANLKVEEYKRAQIDLLQITATPHQSSGHPPAISHPAAPVFYGGLGEGAPIVKMEPVNPVSAPNWPAAELIHADAPLFPPAAAAATTPRRPASPPPVGWPCPVCTFVNLPLRPGCDQCGTARPADYQVPAGYQPTDRERRITDQEMDNRRKLEETRVKKRRENFQRLMQEDEQELVPNKEAFTCPICFVDYEPGEGVTLRECLHNFCKDCLHGTIVNCEDAEVTCPNQDGEISCEFKLHQREIKALVSEVEYCRFLGKGLAIAENRSADSYHCVTADCLGWCFYEDMVNDFLCPICKKSNCLTCKAIHEGMDCQEYQDDLKLRSDNDQAAMQTNLMLQTMVQTGDAMHCPTCKVIVQKKDGCDWICCSICKTEICWVTKGARWGPNGTGDTSGGCQCRINDRMCHPDCMNCH